MRGSSAFALHQIEEAYDLVSSHWDAVLEVCNHRLIAGRRSAMASGKDYE